MSDVKKMNITEFREIGFLQEVNRQFLHPCGLALEVVVLEDGTECLGGVWDYRDDPEGVLYTDLSDEVAATKAANVSAEIKKHANLRVALIGSVIQPIGSVLRDSIKTEQRHPRES